MKTKKLMLSLAALVLIMTGCSTETDSLTTEQANSNLTVETVTLEDFEDLITVTDLNIENSNRFFTDCIQEERYKINWIGDASVNSVFGDFESVRDTTRSHFESLGLDIAFRLTPATDLELWIFNYESFDNGLICPGSETEGEVNDSTVVENAE